MEAEVEESKEEYIKNVKEQANSYERTIQTILAFDSAVRWDDVQKDYLRGSYFLPGRGLLKDPSEPDDTVTPDIVEQLSTDYGIIAEVKITASTERDFADAYEQICNYDIDLVGWKTANEKVRLHDLSLLVDDFKKNTAKRYFQAKRFRKKFTLVACAVELEDKMFYKIEKYYGSFSDKRVENKLGGDPIGVPMDPLEGGGTLFQKMSRVKFYDTEPPVEYTMTVLWMNAFSTLMEKKRRGTSREISVTTGEITDFLGKMYAFEREDEHQPSVPKRSWVRHALDSFVEIGWASKDQSNHDTYQVRYSYQRKKNIIEVFAEKRWRVRRKSARMAEERQLEFDPFKT